MTQKKAVVLLSGGLDSATALYVARSKGFRVEALVFDYGQRHKRELKSAFAVARKASCACRAVKISLPWKGSSLLDRKIKVPRRRRALATKRNDDIPSTYVPARNTIFLGLALSCAEACGARDIFIGANALDYSGYPDCRPQYVRAFNRLSALATKCGVERRPITIRAPLIRLSKAGIIKLGIKLGVPYELTWSCYEGGRSPCGKCDSCLLRAKGFREAGLTDPLLA